MGVMATALSETVRELDEDSSSRDRQGAGVNVLIYLEPPAPSRSRL
jgi:hypothetical protein